MKGNGLVFSTTTEYLRIPPEALVYVEAAGNYSTLHTADGNTYTLTMQLGQVERRIGDASPGESTFIRIGKSLIVNRDYIMFINPARQRMLLSDCRTFRHEAVASREALRALKDLLDET